MIAQAIKERLASQPEGTPVSAKEFLHLASRAAIDQALSRLCKSGELMRAGRGLYVRPIQTRFGARPPAVPALVSRLSQKRGETVVPSGAAAANSLGLTAQVPVRAVYLTSGRSRRLALGAETVELRHAPGWLLLLPNSRAGQALRALAWLGPQHAQEALGHLRRLLSPSEREEMIERRAFLPGWLAKEVSALAA